MRHIETFQSFNEEFDIISKIKDYLNKKLKNISYEFFKGLKSDLINFAESNNLSLQDLKDKKKVEMALMSSNENFTPYNTGIPPGPWKGFRSDEEDRLTPEERKEIAKANAKWVVDHPILHKLSKYTFLASLIVFVGEMVGIFFIKQSQGAFITSVAASIIVMVFTLVFGNITWSLEDAKKELESDNDEDYYKNVLKGK
jgi:hypothetical protein